MQWYYAKDGRQIGPVSEDDFQNLVQNGTIASNTLIWRQGMPDWLTLSQLQSGYSGGAVCSQCGRGFSEEDMIRFGNNLVCADCKPLYVQKMKEGVSLPGHMEYGGFWIRFGAKIIDGIILGIIQQIF